jgi:hypothetical protein
MLKTLEAKRTEKKALSALNGIGNGAQSPGPAIGKCIVSPNGGARKRAWPYRAGAAGLAKLAPRGCVIAISVSTSCAANASSLKRAIGSWLNWKP